MTRANEFNRFRPSPHYFVICAPHGWPLPHTVRHSLKESIAAYLDGTSRTWRSCREDGYHYRKIALVPLTLRDRAVAWLKSVRDSCRAGHATTKTQYYFELERVIAELRG